MSAPSCRAASKADSQARWRAKPENQGYFSGPVNVARVQAWRACHPGYRRGGRDASAALQDISIAQPIDSKIETVNPAGSPLQDDIVRTTDRLLRLGQDILATSAGSRFPPVPTAEPVVIDYETFCKIHDCHDRQGLTIAQTARALGLHPQTVATWVARTRFEPRRSRAQAPDTGGVPARRRRDRRAAAN